MRAGFAAALLCLLSACARAPVQPAVVPAGAPPGFPSAYYAEAIARGERVFRVDAARSLAVVRVYRAGALARFGHDHVVASRDVHGYVRVTDGAARADLYAPLASLSVDEPALRAAHDFDTTLSPGDIEATRRNMLDAVLEAGRFPYVVLRVTRAAFTSGSSVLEAVVTLHGRSRRLAVDVELDRPSATTIRARGRLALAQSDFGIRPFSALAGALRVADRLDVVFSLYAERVPAP